MNSSSQTFRRFAVVFGVVALLSVSACSGKKTKGDESSNPNSSSSSDENALGDSDSGKAMGMQTIHFPFDAFTLTDEAKSALQANANIMKEKTSVKVQVEGHCDHKGGIQYNIALGEKRANAVKKYLQDLGVSGDRLTTISYGKERPLDTATTDDADSKNRRANFAITSR